MWIKINSTSWNINEVLKHEKEAFINLTQHRALIHGSEEKKTKELSDVYSICLVQSKLFSNENGGANVEAGGKPGYNADSKGFSEENITGAGTSEQGSAVERSKRKRNKNNTVLQANNVSDQAAEEPGNEVRNA